MKTKIKPNEQPQVKTDVHTSKDGNWVITRTTIIDIKPLSYFADIEKICRRLKK